jgi:hypothetical protein
VAEYIRYDPLVVAQGDDRAFSWALLDADGEPINLQGFTAKAQVRAHPRSAEVLHEWSTANGKAVLGGGALTLKVNDSETWDWDRGVYDIHLTDGDGNTEVLARGSIVVVPAVTR